MVSDPTAALTAVIAEMVAAEVERQLVGRADAESPWMTADQCAAYLSCAPKRIRNLTSQGRIPVVREGRRTLYDRREIDSWLRSLGEHPWR